MSFHFYTLMAYLLPSTTFIKEDLKESLNKLDDSYEKQAKIVLECFKNIKKPKLKTIDE